MMLSSRTLFYSLLNCIIGSLHTVAFAGTVGGGSGGGGGCGTGVGEGWVKGGRGVGEEC